MSDSVSKPSAETVAAKLPFEREHLEALQRMQTLESYYRWGFDLVAGHLGNRVLDAGCGLGNLIALMQADPQRHVYGVDLSTENVATATQRFKANSNVHIEQADLDDQDVAQRMKSERFDTITCFDVLEHVEQDVELLKRFREIIEPGGHLLIKVPACSWLFGSVDEASSHYRRYSLSELRDKATQAGWKPLKLKYMNIFGVGPYWLKSRVLRKQSNFSRTFKPWQLTLIRRLVPVLSKIDRLIGPPIGQSAILIAVNPDENQTL